MIALTEDRNVPDECVCITPGHLVVKVHFPSDLPYPDLIDNIRALEELLEVAVL